jgi:hypothetical protein
MELIKDVADNVQEMVRGEFRLARAETSEKVAQLAKGAATIAGGAILGLYAFAFLLVLGHDLLSDVVSTAVSALIIASVLGILAFALITVGRKKIKALPPTLQRTVQSVRKDVRLVTHPR